MSNPNGNEGSLMKFKPQWNHGTTKTIRVPIAIAAQVLKYARELDKLPIENSAPENLNAIANSQESQPPS
jgi:hypothetical protein